MLTPRVEAVSADAPRPEEPGKRGEIRAALVRWLVRLYLERHEDLATQAA